MEYTLKLEAPWQQVKELLKEINPDLSDEDLQYEPGQDEALIQRLAVKMNREAEHIKMWIESASANRGKAS